MSLTTMIDYAGGTNPVYIGTAAPGTATNAFGWTIKMLTYDANGNVTEVQWGGSAPQRAAPSGLSWDNRANYTYA
jgi:hypothetical protein